MIKKVRTLLLVSSALMMTALAQPPTSSCGERYKVSTTDPSGCELCNEFQRGQSLSGRPNQYCGANNCTK